jgi:hypothetical protein
MRTICIFLLFLGGIQAYPGSYCSLTLPEPQDCDPKFCRGKGGHVAYGQKWGTCCLSTVDEQCIRCNIVDFESGYGSGTPGVCVKCKKGWKLKDGKCVKKNRG